MDTNEPGREPTEPTDAELFDEWFADHVWDSRNPVEMGREAFIAGRLSGQRPLPDTPAPDEVKQPPEHFCTYPDCRCHPDKLEGWCAKGLPTPISLWRQNAQLRAEVARAAFDLQCAATDAHALTARVAEFEHDAALLRALAKTWEDFSAKFQQDAKVAEARVAELDKRLSVIRNWSLVEEGNESDWNVDWNRGYSAARRWVAMWFKNDAAPGKEPTSE